jgi:hypothetical protein
LDNKELVGMKLLDVVLDFNLVKYEGEIYFVMLLNEHMHSIMFQVDSLEAIEKNYYL